MGGDRVARDVAGDGLWWVDVTTTQQSASPGGARGPQPPGECGDATERLVAVVVDVEDDVVVVVVVVVDVVVGRCCRCCCCCGDA